MRRRRSSRRTYGRRFTRARRGRGRRMNSSIPMRMRLGRRF
nr:MAG: hypothetical protein [Microvirus sp.]